MKSVLVPLLVALTFSTPSRALPIPDHSISSVVSLVTCLAVLLLCLFFLFVVKRVFVQNRRVNNSQARQNSNLSLPIGSTSALGSVDSTSTQKDKPAFIVGFFGSPTVEIQCALEKGEWKEDKQHSFAYQIHTETRRPRLEYPSVLDISRRFNHLVSSPREANKRPILTTSQSSNLHSPLQKAVIDPHTPLNRRRFSLPTMSRKPTQDSQRRRHSSLKSAKRRPSIGSPSTRIVSSSPVLNAPLPLSPQLSTSTPSCPSSPSSPRLGSKMSRSFIRPLPPLPSATNSPTPSARAVEISHPYALAHHPRKNVPPSQAAIRTMPHQILSPTTTFLPLRLSVQSNLSPPPTCFISPPPALTHSAKPKLKVRTRRSPTIEPIGPSPLRTMILPGSLDSELSSYSQLLAKNNAEKSSARDRPPSAHTSFKYLGDEVVGGVSTYLAEDAANDTFAHSPRRRHSSVYSGHASSKVDHDDPDDLLGIIRELVEETSAWDPNTVFMSPSFKSLLQESGISASKSESEMSDSRQNTSPGPQDSDSDLSIRSTELDLGLLGVDFFRGDRNVGTTNSRTNTVSLWDGATGERSDDVGVAW